jgi:hypothetical protein
MGARAWPAQSGSGIVNQATVPPVGAGFRPLAIVTPRDNYAKIVTSSAQRGNQPADSG